SLSQHLEAVADTKHWHPLVRRVDDLGHDRGEAGDSAAAQIVAVAESTGEHEGVDAVKVVRPVPQGNRLCACQPNRPLCVAVVERARERDDADPHQWVSPAATEPATKTCPSGSATEMLTTSSMTELESIDSAS